MEDVGFGSGSSLIGPRSSDSKQRFGVVKKALIEKCKFPSNPQPRSCSDSDPTLSKHASVACGQASLSSMRFKNLTVDGSPFVKRIAKKAYILRPCSSLPIFNDKEHPDAAEFLNDNT
jgi:hypothetical protein